MAKKLLLLFIWLQWALFLIPNSSKAQHFTATGDFTRAMNLYPLHASINGVNLQTGDEIGIFDGTICTGVIVLTSDLGSKNDSKVMHGAVGADAVETTTKDGFVENRSISFRIWDKSGNSEITDLNVEFYNKNFELLSDDPVFKIGSSAFFSLQVSANTRPVANAGNNQEILERKTGKLDGTGSSDAENSTLSFLWKDIDNLGLNSLTSAEPAFIAPEVTSTKKFRVALTVNDGELNSLPDTMVVTVKNENLPPVADAGSNLQVTESQSGLLDGSNSMDPQGLNLSYFWQIIPNEFSLGSPHSAITTFTAPAVSNDKVYQAVLTVSNSAGLIQKDTILITVRNLDENPIANAGSDISINENTEGSLDGTASIDPQNKPLSYTWKDVDGLGLNELNISKPTFTAPEVNVNKAFRVELKVGNGEKFSTDTVLVMVKQVNRKPVANAGSDRKVVAGDELQLNGGNSFDPDGDALTYFWKTPDGITLQNDNTSTPNLTIPENPGAQLFVFELIVTDEYGLKDTSSVTVEIVQNHAPVIVAELYVEATEGEEIQLDAESSYDPDDDELVFIWSALLSNEKSMVTFNDFNSHSPILKVPQVNEDRILKLELKVSDGKERTREIIDVFIKNLNQPPVANAGDDLVVPEGEIFILDGGKSIDPDGDKISCNWFSNDIVVQEPESDSLVLTAPEVEKDQDIYFVLNVTDGNLSSTADTVKVTVLQVNKAPEFLPVPEALAEIGQPFTVDLAATDSDKLDKLTIYSDELPDWLTLADNGDGTATIFASSVPRDESLIGKHSYVISADDSEQQTNIAFNMVVTIKTGTFVAQEREIKIYPNPTNGWVSIDFGSNLKDRAQIRFYNATGRLILIEEAHSQVKGFNLTNYPAGMYHIKINTAEINHTQKIIVK